MMTMSKLTNSGVFADVNKGRGLIASDHYIKKPGEVFKPAVGFENYQISNFGNLIDQNGTLRPKIYKHATHSYLFNIKNSDGKYTTKSCEILIMETFSKKRMIWGVVDGKRVKRLQSWVGFIDGDKSNLNLSNLKWKGVLVKSNKKRRFEFNTGQKLIDEINSNINDNNKEDCLAVINFLNGDQSAIWNLFLKYNSVYHKFLKHYLLFSNNNSKASKKIKLKENTLQIQDIITEGCIKMISKIKKGRFVGKGGFPEWSGIVLRNYMAMFFKKKKRALLQDKTETYFT